MVNRITIFAALATLSLIISGCQISPVYTQKISQNTSVGAAGLKGITGITYSLPKGRMILEAKAIKGKKKDEEGNEVEYIKKWNYTITSDIVTTSSPVFTLEHRGSFLYSDNLGLVSENGLLKSVDVKSEDKTGAVIVKATELVGEILKATSTQGGLALFDDGTPKERQEFVEEFEPSTDGLDYINYRLSQEGHRGVKIYPYPGEEFIEEAPNDWTTSAKGLVYFKTPASIKLMVEDNGKILTNKTFIYPSPYIGSYKISRASFITKETKLTFEKGMLASATIDHPSQLYGALSIPVDGLKAILSIPGELLTFKIESAQSDTELLNAYKANIEAEAALATAKSGADATPE